MNYDNFSTRCNENPYLLLAHTDWSVGEIAYSLGLEYPTYFNNFFKKHTGGTPLTFQRAQVPVA
jgi:AraC family transcriptional activator of pobA